MIKLLFINWTDGSVKASDGDRILDEEELEAIDQADIDVLRIQIKTSAIEVKKATVGHNDEDSLEFASWVNLDA